MKKIRKLITIIIFFVLIISLITPIYAENAEDSENISVENTSESTFESESASETEEQSIDEKLNIQSKAVTLIDADSGEIIYSKNADEKMYPASTTKIMTAILVLENGNLSDIVTVDESSLLSIPSGYTSSYLVENEEISVSDLLKALLVNSSNDAANVLAVYISGSVDDFVNLMNQKAAELGCTNTNFVNTNGIQDENHYSTANDLAIIAKYCMQNSTFRALVTLETCTIPATNKSEERTYKNSNAMILSTSEYYREDCIGIKTGYTSQAEHCLICAGSKDDIEVIAIILYADTAKDRYTDASKLLDYGYEYLEAEKLRLAEEEALLALEEENEDSSISINNIFSQSFWDYIVQNDMLILILVIPLILIIALIIIIGKGGKRNKYKKPKYKNFKMKH